MVSGSDGVIRGVFWKCSSVFRGLSSCYSSSAENGGFNGGLDNPELEGCAAEDAGYSRTSEERAVSPQGDVDRT